MDKYLTNIIAILAQNSEVQGKKHINTPSEYYTLFAINWWSNSNNKNTYIEKELIATDKQTKIGQEDIAIFASGLVFN